MQQEIEKNPLPDRWQKRRKVALTSFLMLCVTTVAMLIYPLVGSSETAAIVREFTPVLITLIMSFSGIVLGWMGLATVDDVKIGKP